MQLLWIKRVRKCRQATSSPIPLDPQAGKSPHLANAHQAVEGEVQRDIIPKLKERIKANYHHNGERRCKDHA
jgi:hypothetical protein